MTAPIATKRSVKGSPLTAAEMDGNFTQIETYLSAQEAKNGAAINPDGTLKKPLVLSGTSAEGTDSYRITVQTTPASYSDLKGAIILLTPDVVNSGAAELKVNPLSTFLPIRKYQDQELVQKDILANHLACLLCDGTYFQLLNPATVRKPNYHADSGNDGIAYVLASLPSEFSEPAAYFSGYMVWIKAALTNVSVSPTLKVGALSAAPIVMADGGTVPKGAIRGGGIYGFVHDGTSFILVSSSIARYAAADAAALAGVAYVKDFAHGLGVVPTQIRVVVRANAADATPGYAQNDEVSLESVHDTGAGPAHAIVADATNVKVILARTGARTIINKTTAARSAMTEANWNVKVYAEA